jgi:hypothetical protein
VFGDVGDPREVRQPGSGRELFRQAAPRRLAPACNTCEAASAGHHSCLSWPGQPKRPRPRNHQPAAVIHPAGTSRASAANSTRQPGTAQTGNTAAIRGPGQPTPPHHKTVPPQDVSQPAQTTSQAYTVQRTLLVTAGRRPVKPAPDLAGMQMAFPANPATRAALGEDQLLDDLDARTLDAAQTAMLFALANETDASRNAVEALLAEAAAQAEAYLRRQANQ